MHYMALPVSFRWDEAFVARIDEARGDVPRSVFVRRAVEQALDGGPLPVFGTLYRQHVPSPLVAHVRSSAQSKRDVRPIPKKGT